MNAKNTIYVPKGAAGEYAELAINIWRGCAHGCTYCFVPAIVRRERADFYKNPEPRRGIVEAVRRAAPKFAGDPRTILLSFTSDPYQPEEKEREVTREILWILAENNCRATVLTKNPHFAMERDLDVFKAGGFSLGTTLVTTRFEDDEELGAPGFGSRFAGLKLAKDAGLSTWASLEPVVDPEQTLELVHLGLHPGEGVAPIVDHWKVGKLNHDAAREAEIDWRDFTRRIVKKLEEAGADYYLKKSLREFAPKGWKPKGE